MFSWMKNDKPEEEEPHFHKSWLLLGPHQVGDPDDLWIRNVERENAIPKILIEKTKKEKCPEELKRFFMCAGEHQGRTGFGFYKKCRLERDLMNECLIRWYWDPDFVQEITKKYLEDRSYYRRTGRGKR